MVAVFADPGGAKAKDFTAQIGWGDGTPTVRGHITEPGGPGWPFIVGFSHTYQHPGVYPLFVIITGKGATYIIPNSKATVTAGGGGATDPGQSPNGPAEAIFLTMTSPQETSFPQVGTGLSIAPAAVPGANTGLKVRLTSPSATVQAIAPAANDAYWESLHLLRGHRVTDPNGWAVDHLVLALQGVGSAGNVCLAK
jgi:hypothetical protein